MANRPITVIRRLGQMQRFSAQVSGRRKRLGFVPTMGALHAGHAALIRRSASVADVTVVSIFVNPTQFAPTEDLKKYPRQLREDVALATAAGADLIFAPDADEIYPPQFQTWVEVEGLTSGLEGARRPTHFRGVTTIVAKLFNLVRPDVVIFGMKDFQQAVVLRQMTRDLGYPIRFIIAPTARERDGLALSSRNRYLNVQERTQAPAFFAALRLARRLVLAGERSTAVLRRQMIRQLRQEAPSARIDYLAFNRFEDLEPVEVISRGTICSGAILFPSARLIDNLRLL